MRVSDGLDTQNTQGTRIDLSWFRLLSPTCNSMVFFKLEMPNQGIAMVEPGEFDRGFCGAILGFFL